MPPLPPPTPRASFDFSSAPPSAFHTSHTVSARFTPEWSLGRTVRAVPIFYAAPGRCAVDGCALEGDRQQGSSRRRGADA